jgi:hypothetical protein
MIHQFKMDAAEVWVLNEFENKVFYGWDSREQRFRNTYDQLRQVRDEPEVLYQRTI